MAAGEQQAHAQRLAEITQDKGKKKLTYAIIGVVAVVLAGGGVGAWQFNEYMKKTAAEAQQADAARKELERKLAENEKQIADNEARAKQLAKALDDATDEAAKMKIKAEQDALAAQTNALRAGAPRPGGPAKSETPAPKKEKCQPGDPMCTD